MGYILKTNLGRDVASKETIHNRYKDLAQVEWAFLPSKTVSLKVRPVHVRIASHTRGHVFVVMLAYLIIAELARSNQIPLPRPFLQLLLDAAQVRLPEVLPHRGVTVATKKKLAPRLKKR